MRNAYTVTYKLHEADTERTISVLASNKAEAYAEATFKAIPKAEGEHPYSSWVSSVTYQNGNYRTFNTFEGLPY